jgi:hypothetical protein
MIEEKPFFNWARFHLAVFGQLYSSLRKAIGLAAGIELRRSRKLTQ